MCLQDFKIFLFRRYSNGNPSLQGFIQHITRERDSSGSQFCQEAQHLNRCVSELISEENRFFCFVEGARSIYIGSFPNSCLGR